MNNDNLIQLLNPENNLRVDRQFGFQISNFNKYGSIEEQLLKDLIVYMSYRFQKNLFGFIDFDIDDFCKTMKQVKSRLLTVHPDPIFYKLNPDKTPEEHLQLQKKYGNNTKYRVWRNKLENALLILQNERFYFSNENSTQTHQKITYANFTYLKEIHILFQRTGKTIKFSYQYKPTEEFEKTLVNYFLVSNLESYLKIKKGKLINIYFNILFRSQNHLNNAPNSICFSIQQLAELMNVSTEKINEKNGFTRVKDNIKRKFKTKFLPNVENEIKGIKLEFIKGKNSKYYNVPVISWNAKNKEELEIIKQKTYDDIFYTELLKDLSTNFYDNYQTHELDQEIITKNFLNWIFSFKDYDIKTSKYISVFANVKGNKKDVKQQASIFFANLAGIGAFQKKERFIFYKNNTFSYKIAIPTKKIIEKDFKDIRIFITSLLNHHRVLLEYYGNSQFEKHQKRLRKNKMQKFTIPKYK